MEEWQVQHINRKLAELSKSTNCSTLLLTKLQADNVLDEEEIESLSGDMTRMTKANKLYETLKTRIGAFDILIKCLEETKQSGVVKILKDHHPNLCNIASISYDKNQLLRKGNGGTKVFKGTFDKRDAAVKVINSFNIPPRKTKKEIDVLKLVDDHPNIVRYFMAEIQFDYIYIAMELCLLNLDEELKNGRTKLVPSQIIPQCTDGLAHLHQRGIVHGDLKPANILISRNHQVKIADFGLSQELPEDKTHVHVSGIYGTPEWMAPEHLDLWNRTNTRSQPAIWRLSADVFALGCIFYYTLSSGKHPFGEKRLERQMNIIEGKPILQEWPVASSWINIIRKMIARQPEKRPIADWILSKIKWPNFEYTDPITDDEMDEIIEGPANIPAATSTRGIPDLVPLANRKNPSTCSGNMPPQSEQMNVHDKHEGERASSSTSKRKSNDKIIDPSVNDPVQAEEKTDHNDGIRARIVDEQKNKSSSSSPKTRRSPGKTKLDNGEQRNKTAKKFRQQVDDSECQDSTATPENIAKNGKPNELNSDITSVFQVKNGLAGLRDFIEGGGNFQEKDHSGRSILHVAVLKRDIDMVRYLVSVNMPLNDHDNNGRTPLLLAGKEFDIIKFLIRSNANINVFTRSGNNIAHVAASKMSSKNFHNFVCFLLRSPNTDYLLRLPNVDGRTPLHQRMYADEPIDETTFILLTQVAGFNVNASDVKGNTLLLSMLKGENNANLFKRLVLLGSDLRKCNSNGENVLHLAVENPNEGFVKYFITKGVDLKQKDGSGNSPLDRARIYVELFNKKGPRVKREKIFKILADAVSHEGV